jgi:hypothetical protein
MTFKRLLTPMFLLGLMVMMGNMAYAQVVTCGISAVGVAIGAVPALPGVTDNGSNVGHTEVNAGGKTGIPDIPGGGRVRITCTNQAPGPFTAPATAANTPATAVSPGVVALTVSYGVPITTTTSGHPAVGQDIRLLNQTGDFVVNNSSTAPGAGNVAINTTSYSGGTIVIALGGPALRGATPPGGMTFSASAAGCAATNSCPVVSTFELAGVLLSTNGKSGAINATMTSSGGISIVAGSITSCTTSAAPGPCAVVITNVQASLADPVVASGSLPTSVTSQANLGTTPIAGGAAVLNSSGGAVKSNFTIRIQENYADLFKSSAQFNAGAVFPNSPASSVQVNIALSNIPTGFDISGCSAVLTDASGNAPAAPFLGNAAAVSATNFTAASPVLTVIFTGPVDPGAVDVLWVTCTRVAAGSATLPLPSTAITAQVFLGPVGSALSSTGGAQTSLTTGQIPRYQQALVPATPITVVVFPPANTVLLLTFGFVGPGYNTGIAVANTTTDPFGVAGGGGSPSSGTVTFLLVKNDGTSKSYTTTTGSPGSGLTGAGVVASGSTYVVNLSEILSAASFGTSFTGYVFVSANFTFAHGAATIYTTSTGAAALSSPVLVVTNAAGSGISSAAPRSTPESLGQ